MTQPRLSEALVAARAAAQHARHASRDHARLVVILTALGDRSEALAELLSTVQMAPGRAEDYEALAFAAFGLGEHQIARDYYARVTEFAPRDATAWYNLATSERNVGRLADTEAACDRALHLDPHMAQAALLRSQAKTQRADDNHIGDLRHRLAQAVETPALILLSYALGKELDDIGDYDEAFKYFDKGARTRRSNLQYDVKLDIQKLDRIRAAFDAGALARSRTTDRSTRYAFVLGLPRSGTTLIERVLTSHPNSRSNGETDNFMQALMECTIESNADLFDRAARADGTKVASSYMRRAGDVPPGGLVIEKLPLNYLYAGAIHLSLPNAPIILITRSPVDNCFGMYSTLFGNAYPFSYDLQELARYFIAYQGLIDHWRSNLADQILEVQYESFIKDPTTTGRKIANHVGISWADNMIQIEQNRRASATASAAQIRRPIYTSSVNRWHNYGKHLVPLVEKLSEGGISID